MPRQNAVEPQALASSRNVRAALSRQAYREGRVRLADGDLSGCDCLVATRQGLFGVSRDGIARIVAHGFFFGIRRHRDHVFVFEACDRPFAPTCLGRIVRFDITDRRLHDGVVVTAGLDNQCHQIAILDDRLCIVDTANQTIRRFALDGTFIDSRTPLPVAPRDDTSGAYVHVNAIAGIAGRIALLFHNGSARPPKQSELAWCDADWKLERRETLAGHGCHDIVADDTGVIWHCGSMAGEVINSAGLRVKVSDRMTRGLVLTSSTIMVGTSLFGTRGTREDLAGSVLFLDRQFNRQAEIALPAAPTDLIVL